MTVYIDNIFTGFVDNPKTCSTLVMENPHTIVLYDKYPQAKIHLLIIPKGKYKDVYQFLLHASKEEQEDFNITLKQIIDKFDLYEKGFNLLVNTQESHSQQIPHYHMHILCHGGS
jgi:histidine triad (HIT) family protein